MTRRPALALIGVALVFTALAGCSSDEDGSTAAPSSRPPLERSTVYVGIAVHLEGWNLDERPVFERYIEEIRQTVAVLERHDAVFTWETSNLIDAIEQFGVNVLSELDQRGQGVGVHADLGGRAQRGGPYTVDRFAGDLSDLRSRMSSLGVTASGVSGICSKVDWVTAALRAGFESVSGTVSYCLLSLPMERVPGEHRDCPAPGACHEAFPPSLEGRLVPWRAASGADWIDPADEGLLLLHTGGAVPCAAEEAAGAQSPTMCDFTEDDIDVVVEELESAVAMTGPGEFGSVLRTWSIGSPVDHGLLEQLLQRVDPLVADGSVVWASLDEVTAAFETWQSAG